MTAEGRKVKTIKVLLDKVQSGKAVPRDFLIAGRLNWFAEYEHVCHKAYGGSLDACRELHEYTLPGWNWQIENDDQAYLWRESDALECFGLWCDKKNPARAWLIAILKALIMESE